MITITLGDNTNRTNIVVDENSTIKTVLEENGIDYTGGGIQLDGVTVSAGDMNKSFADLGVKEHCYLFRVAKLTNA